MVVISGNSLDPVIGPRPEIPSTRSLPGLAITKLAKSGINGTPVAEIAIDSESLPGLGCLSRLTPPPWICRRFHRSDLDYHYARVNPRTHSRFDVRSNYVSLAGTAAGVASVIVGLPGTGDCFGFVVRPPATILAITTLTQWWLLAFARYEDGRGTSWTVNAAASFVPAGGRWKTVARGLRWRCRRQPRLNLVVRDVCSNLSSTRIGTVHRDRTGGIRRQPQPARIHHRAPHETAGQALQPHRSL
jgi:hypothetical protein